MRIPASPTLLLAAGAILAVAGCKGINQPVLARTDAQLAGDIQSKLSADKTFSSPGSPDIHVAVQNGVATLTGEATDNNARLEAGTDASQVPGVKEVVNDLTVPEAAQTAEACIPPTPAHRAHLRVRQARSRAPEQANSYEPPAPAPAPAPAPPAYAYAAPPVVVAPAPVVVPVRPLYYGPRYRGYWARPVRPYAYRPGVGIYIHP